MPLLITFVGEGLGGWGDDLRRTVSNAIKNIIEYSVHKYCTLYVRIGHLLELKLKKIPVEYKRLQLCYTPKAKI